MLSVTYAFETETIKLGNSLHSLYVSEKTGPGSFTSKPLPGVNGQDVMQALGKLGLLKSGFERARISDAPFLVEMDASGKEESFDADLSGRGFATRTSPARPIKETAAHTVIHAFTSMSG